MINLENAEILAALALQRRRIKDAQAAEADLPEDDPRRIETRNAAGKWAGMSLSLGIDPSDESWATLETVFLEEVIASIGAPVEGYGEPAWFAITRDDNGNVIAAIVADK